jgi:hypothetical protein
MPANFGSRNSKLKNGGTTSKVHDSVMAICSEDKRNAFKHTQCRTFNFLDFLPFLSDLQMYNFSHYIT